QLPFCQSLVKETLRLYPPIPLGLPHMASVDDEYLGYHIPRNSIMIPNIWAIAHDPRLYGKPNEFIPERFMDRTENVLDPSAYIFGFGRRMCPVLDFGMDFVNLICLSILASFNMTHEKDSEGNDIVSELEFGEETVSR
ncbi:hypothetical protein M422DRAFT_190182, partial [Sphaerobolus stellatus SS14]